MSFRDDFTKLVSVPEEKIIAGGFDGKDDYCETLRGAINSMKKYFNSVIDYTVEVDIASRKYDGEIQRYMISKADKDRNICHNNAIANCNMLNRICQKMDIEPIVKTDTSDRYAVADFIFSACSDLYLTSQTRSKYHNFTEYIMDNKIKDEHKRIGEKETIDELIERFSHPQPGEETPVKTDTVSIER